MESTGTRDASKMHRYRSTFNGRNGVFVKPAMSISRLKTSSSIGIEYSDAKEDVPTMDLLKSANACLDKTIAVFVQLCMEVRQLAKEGHQYLVKCLFADEDLCEILSNEADSDDMGGMSQTNDDEMAGIVLSPKMINKISDLLDMLFQTQQFVERCFVVLSQIIKQMLALFSTEESSYITVNQSSLHFQVCTQFGFINCVAFAI